MFSAEYLPVLFATDLSLNRFLPAASACSHRRRFSRERALRRSLPFLALPDPSAVSAAIRAGESMTDTRPQKLRNRVTAAECALTKRVSDQDTRPERRTGAKDLSFPSPAKQEHCIVLSALECALTERASDQDTRPERRTGAKDLSFPSPAKQEHCIVLSALEYAVTASLNLNLLRINTYANSPGGGSLTFLPPIVSRAPLIAPWLEVMIMCPLA